MNDTPIYLTQDDHTRLTLLLSALSGTPRSPTIEQLRHEVTRATVLDRNALPPTIVTMDSQVEIEDLATGEIEHYTLTLPERANVDHHMLSVLAPVGTALIGFPEGAEVEWTTPGGPRRLKILRVIQP